MNTHDLIDNVYDVLFKNDENTQPEFFIDNFYDSFVDRENCIINLTDGSGNNYVLILQKV